MAEQRNKKIAVFWKSTIDQAWPSGPTLKAAYEVDIIGPILNVRKLNLMRLCYLLKIGYLVSLSQDQLHSASHTLTHTRITREPAQITSRFQGPTPRASGSVGSGSDPRIGISKSSMGIHAAGPGAALNIPKLLCAADSLRPGNRGLHSAAVGFWLLF